MKEIRINQMYFNVLPCQSKDGDYWEILKDNKWEPETLEFMRRHIRPDKDYLELGGWIGSTVMMAYSLNPRKIYSIEADPSNFQTLKQNIYNNRMEDKVHIFNACLTDRLNSDKIISFGTANDEKPNSSSHRIDNGSRIKVKTVNAFPFLKKNCDLENVNCVNIDIESSEILMGDLFRYFENKNAAILLSLHNPFWKNKEKSALDMFNMIKGYTIIDPFTYNEFSKQEIKEKLFKPIFCSVILRGKGK